jgi:hypothetical protein
MFCFPRISISRYMCVMRPTWCNIYLHFIEWLHHYMFRAC